MKNKIEVFFYGGYGGVPKCRVTFGGKNYVLEIEYIEMLLRNMIGLKGMDVLQTTRQKYPRIKIKGADKLYKLPKTI